MEAYGSIEAVFRIKIFFIIKEGNPLSYPGVHIIGIEAERFVIIGNGKRISIRDTRGIIDAILDGSIEKAPTKTIPYFDFVVPTELPGVDPKILDPRDTYADAAEWTKKAEDLAGRFIKNFAKFTGNEAGKALVAAGPKL